MHFIKYTANSLSLAIVRGEKNGNQMYVTDWCSCRHALRRCALSQTTQTDQMCRTLKQRTIEFVNQNCAPLNPLRRNGSINNGGTSSARQLILWHLWINILKIYGLMFRCQWHISIKYETHLCHGPVLHSWWLNDEWSAWMAGKFPFLESICIAIHFGSHFYFNLNRFSVQHSDGSMRWLT